MKRWNGWGDAGTTYNLPSSACEYLAKEIGKGLQLEDVSLEQALAGVSTPRIPAHPLISTNPEDRLRHARGQSLPDFVALRSGRIGNFPDGIAYPASDEEVRELLKYAGKAGIKVIPYGGGTSVVGHVNPTPGVFPVLTMDMGRMKHLTALDETSRLATFEAGVSGPEIEDQLNARGLTLGHFPQSFELSTLGGWIVTRSSGQQSYHYGRIEGMFAGGHLETPCGEMELPVHPASAAGPDLKQILLGSEGRMGVLTRAVVRVRQKPEFEAFYGVFFHNWEEGIRAVRGIAQSGIPISMLRMSNAVETATTLALSGKEAFNTWAGRGLKAIGFSVERALLVFGVTGARRLAIQARDASLAIIRQNHGLMTGAAIGKMWKKSRFLSPYLRNTLWEAGYALDTLETAVPWSQVMPLALETQAAIRNGLEDKGEKVLVFAHLSHVYNDGASVYVTYLYRRAPDPEETLHRWHLLKEAASRIILAHGGTISHQHGVGVDHLPYLAEEKGKLGIQALRNLMHEFDPAGIMNPGKLIDP